MTIDYSNKSEHMSIECDICGEIEEYDGSWGDCMAFAKLAGWVNKKHTDGEWYHFCSDECARKL